MLAPIFFSFLACCGMNTHILKLEKQQVDFFKEIKDRIVSLQEKIANSDSLEEKSFLHYQLAHLFLRDQEEEMALKEFLAALKCAKQEKKYSISQEEKEIYEKMEEEYLQTGYQDPSSAAHRLIERAEPLVDTKKEYFHLSLLVSTAYANLGNYEKFFEFFFAAYPFLHDSFLAYKTQGILFLKIMQKTKIVSEREEMKEEALRLLKMALDKNPKDPSLYKILIFHAKDEKNDALLLSYLQKMIERKVLISRSDIYFFVKEAVLLEEYEMAQSMIDYAKELYDYSRTIAAAEAYLNQHKGK